MFVLHLVDGTRFLLAMNDFMPQFNLYVSQQAINYFYGISRSEYRFNKTLE
ncbi:hypothetical protein SAMN04488109_1814 [Chryseolinea serpens]|uniref:Uncharacterized protein n=1 Tax=Chryseolinea serpens TaxID=947013 RepID=A0A1M5MLR7_9BACT|nr:hypothetical protein SAMN04488109_1814 [Chryseolinea serpens]